MSNAKAEASSSKERRGRDFKRAGLSSSEKRSLQARLRNVEIHPCGFGGRKRWQWQKKKRNRSGSGFHKSEKEKKKKTRPKLLPNFGSTEKENSTNFGRSFIDGGRSGGLLGKKKRRVKKKKATTTPKKIGSKQRIGLTQPARKRGFKEKGRRYAPRRGNRRGSQPDDHRLDASVFPQR